MSSLFKKACNRGEGVDTSFNAIQNDPLVSFVCQTAENCRKQLLQLRCSGLANSHPRSSAARFKIPLFDLPGHGHVKLTAHIPA